MIRRLLYFFLLLLVSCHDDQTNDNQSVICTDNYSNILDKHNSLNLSFQNAKFICGDTTSYYSDIQNSSLYKTLQQKLNSRWNVFFIRNYALMRQWSDRELLGKYDSVIFYPFGGPDITTVVALFPKAKKFVLVGLENIGYLPMFDKFSGNDLKLYFNNLNQSMDLFYELGYFKTKRLQKDLKKVFINGVLHLLVFQIGKIGQLTDLQYFILLKSGQISVVDSLEFFNKLAKGVKIKFKDKNNQVREVYYLQLNLSDENLNYYSEFFCFINYLGEFSVFIKSASYLLHTSEFNILRSFILKNAQFILQDDSGIKYKVLKSFDYKMIFYGKYLKPLKIFSNYYQPELNTVSTERLPFNFGYNSERGALFLISAKKENSEIDYPFYSVQIEMLWNRLDSNDSVFYLLPDVDYYFDEGYYKYTAGKCKTISECMPILEQARKLGYNDAFIVKFTRYSREVVSVQ